MPDSANGQLEARNSDATTSGDSENDVRVETLVAGRTRRSTAGNRLNHLLQKEVDDELELLFAEDEEEEDVEFEGEDGGALSDVELDSSSDDNDQGPAAGQDDLEGEKELEKQDRAERRKKRKAGMVFKRPPVSRVRTKLDHTGDQAKPSTPTPRLKRKSDRVSWLPAVGEGSVRSSSRKQTVQNKQLVHARMQEIETKRRQQIEVMETAAKRKEASKPTALTQADRLAEADQTERRNAKSLNRWEVAEKHRLEKQKADLAELKQRQLTRPFVTWWSGPSKWVGESLAATGAKSIIRNDKDIPQAKDVSLESQIKVCKVKDVDPSIVNVSQTELTTNQGELLSSDRSSLSQCSGLQDISAPGAWQAHPKPIAIYPQSGPPKHAMNISSSKHCITENSAFAAPPITEISTRNLIILEREDGSMLRPQSLQHSILNRKKNTVRAMSK